MSESFLGAGDLYIDRLNADGSRNDFDLAGNATKFEIKAESEIKEQTAKGRKNYGQVLATVNLPKPSTIAISLNQLDTETLAMAFLGDTELIAEGAGSVSDEVITANLDKWVELGNRNIDAGSVVVQDEGATMEYVEETDFQINYRLGMIRALSSGSIPAGATILVDYDHSAVSGTRVKGATQPTIKARLLLDGRNFVNNNDCRVEVFEAQLRPTSAVDFLSDDFTSLELEGTLVTPAGEDKPFIIDQSRG